jgi:hypothetical protein
MSERTAWEKAATADGTTPPALTEQRLGGRAGELPFK